MVERPRAGELVHRRVPAGTFNFTVRVWNQTRWDFWERAIGFDIHRCDLFNTGHGVSNVHDGDFVIQQEWLAGD